MGIAGGTDQPPLLESTVSTAEIHRAHCKELTFLAAVDTHSLPSYSVHRKKGLSCSDDLLYSVLSEALNNTSLGVTCDSWYLSPCILHLDTS